MIRAATPIACLGALLMLPASPAHAELTLCNRTSYLMDAAIGLAKDANVTTRGWFRLAPGQCRQVLDGPLDADFIYLHGRTPPVYGNAPLPANGDTALCVRAGDFTLADARGCAPGEQVRFGAARPSDSAKGPTVNLAEEADYDDTQARLAGIQRLLTIAGYDATPIDGVDGAKTKAALARFLRDRKLTADAADKPGIFDALIDAAKHPAGAGFTWCNQTPHSVMAALGLVEMGSIVTRGWYRVPSDQCLKPDVSGDPMRFYSYAEAVDESGHTLQREGTPLAWGGKVELCTRDGRFEVANQKDCASRGLKSAGFAVIAAAGGTATVTFK